MKRMVVIAVQAGAILMAGACAVGQQPGMPTPAQATTTPYVTASAPLGAVTASPVVLTTVAVAEIAQDPSRFRDKRVRILGRGLSVATFPLCPGYIGFDKRVRFFDSAGSSIYAVDRLPAGCVHFSSDSPRVFEGYIRLYDGDVGCLGQTKRESFAYFEVDSCGQQ